MPLTYSNYLRLDELLKLQVPLTEDQEHDESLFIIVHQIYELWFKQLLFEMRYLYHLFKHGNIGQSLQTLKRLNAIFKTIIQQIDVISTLTPLDFMSFRNRLDSASGVQSFQFRELEFLFAIKKIKLIEQFSNEPHIYTNLQQRIQEPSIWDGFILLLHNQKYQIPAAMLSISTTETVIPSPQIQTIIIDIYRSNAALCQICEALIDLDCALQDWRYRHIKMVERTIGSKSGTGGSNGIQYLTSTLFHSAFPDLWAIRNAL